MGVVRLDKETKQCHGSMFVGRGVAGSRMDIKQKLEKRNRQGNRFVGRGCWGRGWISNKR